ncbi:MAG: acyltransferase family protein, partial [Pseudomonadota bacterium]
PMMSAGRAKALTPLLISMAMKHPPMNSKVRGLSQTCARPALIIGAVWLLGLSLFYADALYPSAMGQFAKRALLFGPPYALILYGAVAMEIASGVKAPPWLIKTGDASYALYLVHVPVFLIVGKSLTPFAGPGTADNIVLVGGYFIGGLVAAFLAHAWIERPLLHGGKRLGARVFDRRALKPA